VEEFKESVVSLAAMLILVAFSAFFSGSETAFFSLDRDILRRYRKSPRLSERMVANLRAVPRKLLIALLFSNLIVNVLYLSIGSVIGIRIARRGSEALAVLWGIAVLTFLIVFGEITPKIIASRFPRKVAGGGAKMVYLVQTILLPVTFSLGRLMDAFSRRFLPSSKRPEYVTKDEIKFLANMSRRRGAIDKRQEQMLAGMINLSGTLVRDVMTPYVDIVAYEAGGSVEGLLEKARASGHRRIPVFENSIDNIIGIVQVKDILFGEKKPLREFIRPASFVPELKSALALLDFFRDTRTVLAIAVDEYGQTAGLVTLEDIVEEIVGEIQDESDAEEELVTELADGKYLISGGFNIRQWQEFLERELPESSLEKIYPQVSTLGGFVTMLFQRFPKAGESVEFKNIRFTVKETRKRRITKVLVEYIPPEKNSQKET